MKPFEACRILGKLRQSDTKAWELWHPGPCPIGAIWQSPDEPWARLKWDQSPVQPLAAPPVTCGPRPPRPR